MNAHSWRDLADFAMAVILRLLTAQRIVNRRREVVCPNGLHRESCAAVRCLAVDSVPDIVRLGEPSPIA